MDHNNLARVFGPTLVGHGMSEPSPTTIMRDTNTQPKVGLFLNVVLNTGRFLTANTVNQMLLGFPFGAAAAGRNKCRPSPERFIMASALVSGYLLHVVPP